MAVPCRAFTGSPARYTAATPSGVRRESMRNTELVSSTGPATSTTKAPPPRATATRCRAVQWLRGTTPRSARAPKAQPQSPKASICHGVQGPWPKMKLLTSAASDPTMNPDEAPRPMPATMTTAAMGLKWGTHRNAAREATARAAITAMTTSSRAEGRRCSKDAKKGAMHHSTIRTLATT